MYQAISYKDPDGIVLINDKTVYRYVAHSYKDAYDQFMTSGLYHELVSRGLLIPHEESLLTPEEKAAYYQILVPEFIPFISLPYEWTFSQWQEVILAQLEINQLALQYGMTLKDANPFNFTFHNGQCIFFDTLSFEKYTENSPWVAYRQFCEMMLGPLALMKFNHPDWAMMMKGSINGWGVDFISRNLKRASRTSFAVLVHLHWHARYTHRAPSVGGKSGLNAQKLRLMWQMLHRSIGSWKLKTNADHWSRYYLQDIDSPAYLEHKVDVITRILKDLRPLQVVDLGANSGKFSLLSAAYSQQVIAVESDHSCLEMLWKEIGDKKVTNIQLVHADIAEPPPAIGWKNEERAALITRLNGDMLLGLALVHHLCISRNVPLQLIASLFADLSSEWALVEFIPKSDPKMVQMLANRPDNIHPYDEETFIKAFAEFFVLKESIQLNASGRKLFLWKRIKTRF